MKTQLAILALLTLTFVACPSEPSAAPKGAPAAPTNAALAAPAACQHGVKPELCARCNPALKPAFVAKNDWCAEHERPESQCVICHPDLAKDGVK